MYRSMGCAYKLIGESYIHGNTHGEAAEPELKRGVLD